MGKSALEQVEADIAAVESQLAASQNATETQISAPTQQVNETQHNDSVSENQQNAIEQPSSSIVTQETSQQETHETPKTVPLEDYRKLKDQFNGTRGNMKQLSEELSALKQRLASYESAATTNRQVQQIDQRTQQVQDVEDDFKDIVDSFGSEEIAQPLVKRLASLMQTIKQIKGDVSRLGTELPNQMRQMTETERRAAEDTAYQSKLYSDIPGFEDLWVNPEFQNWLESYTKFGATFKNHLLSSFIGRDTNSIKDIVSNYEDYCERTAQEKPATAKAKNTNKQVSTINKSSELASRVIPDRSSSAPKPETVQTEAPTEAEIDKALDIINLGDVKGNKSSAEYKAAQDILSRAGM